ncbi:MAG: ribosome maturation factor RimM [Chroococcales cyanobacterium]
MLATKITNSNVEDWIEIGTIVSPQGLGGELRVYPNSDFPERFEEPGVRWLQYPNASEPRAIELERGRQVPGKLLYVIKLAGISDRTQAEALRGCKLLVPNSDRPILEEDEYHVSELLDIEVYDQTSGEIVGVVTDVFTAGNDLLEVTLSKQPELDETPTTEKKRKKKPKKAKVLIPFVKEIVPVVDIAAKRIEITPPPGLLEVHSA